MKENFDDCIWNNNRVKQLEELKGLLIDLSTISKRTDAFREAMKLAERGNALENDDEELGSFTSFRFFIQHVYGDMPISISHQLYQLYAQYEIIQDIIIGLEAIHRNQNNTPTLVLILELEEKSTSIINQKPDINFMNELSKACWNERKKFADENGIYFCG